MKYLKEFENLLKHKNPHVLNMLQQGQPIAEIKNALAAIGVSNDDLENLYSWRDGVNKDEFSTRTIEQLEMFPDVIMPSLYEAIHYYSLYTGELNAWNKFLFPIFTDGGG